MRARCQSRSAPAVAEPPPSLGGKTAPDPGTVARRTLELLNRALLASSAAALACFQCLVTVFTVYPVSTATVSRSTVVKPSGLTVSSSAAMVRFSEASSGGCRDCGQVRVLVEVGQSPPCSCGAHALQSRCGSVAGLHQRQGSSGRHYAGTFCCLAQRRRSAM